MEVSVIVFSYRTQDGPEDQRREYSQNYLPPVPVGRNSVGGGVRATYYDIRAFLPGEAACLGTFHGVRVGDGAQVAGSTYTDTSW